MYGDRHTGEQEISAVSGRVGMYGIAHLHKINYIMSTTKGSKGLYSLQYMLHVRFNTWYKI